MITVAATAPDWAPDRASPSPTTSATRDVTRTAATMAAKGGHSVLLRPSGASLTVTALRSTEIARMANV